MSVSLLEVIEAGGYDPTNNIEDANWLLAKRDEFYELVEQAEDFLEEVDRLNELANEEEMELEAMQERADELRQSKREDGEDV